MEMPQQERVSTNFFSTVGQVFRGTFEFETTIPVAAKRLVRGRADCSQETSWGDFCGYPG